MIFILLLFLDIEAALKGLGLPFIFGFSFVKRTVFLIFVVNSAPLLFAFVIRQLRIPVLSIFPELVSNSDLTELLPAAYISRFI